MVLKVPKLLDGEDLANEEFPPDKKSMYTYLMEYALEPRGVCESC
jgi:hypothetical protein